jgi:hypothetical protein
MLTETQIQNAVHSNPAFARSLGWDKKIGSVTAFLGVVATAAHDRQLAQNVERFQAGHPPLQKDGVIGPKTWHLLSKALAEKPTPASDPNAPPSRSSKPTPDRVKALDNWLLSLTHGHPKAKEPWTFYEEIEAYLGPFGEKGYPIGYGKKYCVLFNNDVTLARSPVAREWVRRTTILLQTYIRLYVVSRYEKGTLDSLTEEELRQAAFASHPLAYTRGGLTLVVLVAPHLVGEIVSIPSTEFFGGNAASSWAQALETGELVVPEASGTVLAGFAGPAHTGLFARAAEKDRQEFQHRIRVGEYLTELKKAIEAGKLDRIAWLERVTKNLNSTEYPDGAMSKFAGEVVGTADVRKKLLAARYRQEIRLSPELRKLYDGYDPGWDRW